MQNEWMFLNRETETAEHLNNQFFISEHYYHSAIVKSAHWSQKVMD